MTPDETLTADSAPDPQTLAPEATGPRVFTIAALGWIAFFGGPLAGGFALAYNARRFGHAREAAYALAGGIVATTLLLIVVFQLPDSVTDHWAYRAVTSGLWAAIVLAIAEKTQSERIDAHLAAGGREGSVWVGVGIALVGLAVLMVLGAIVALATPIFEGTPYERAGGGTVYASGDATEADARYVSTALQRFGYFPEGEVARVDRVPDSVRVSMLLIPEVETDTMFLVEIHRLAADLERALKTPVAVVNVVDGFSGRRETVMTDILSPEQLRRHLSAPPPAAPALPAPPPEPATVVS